MLDDARIYDRALSAGEIASIYAGNEDTLAADGNLIVQWRFNETAGDIAEDGGTNSAVYFYYPMGTANLVEKSPPGSPYDPGNIDRVDFADFNYLVNHYGNKYYWPNRP